MTWTALIICVVGALAVLLTIRNAARARQYRRQYRYVGNFQGRRYECILGSADSEGSMRCCVGADESALYLMANSPSRDYRWWMPSAGGYWDFRVHYKTDLRIPWGDLKCRAGRLFFKNVIWFENHSNGFCIYLPEAIGEKLRSDSRGAMPGGRAP